MKKQERGGRVQLCRLMNNTYLGPALSVHGHLEAGVEFRPSLIYASVKWRETVSFQWGEKNPSDLEGVAEGSVKRRSLVLDK